MIFGVEFTKSQQRERLDQAEDYVNERLAEIGEFWQLDANTRVMLGLPPRKCNPKSTQNSPS